MAEFTRAEADALFQRALALSGADRKQYLDESCPRGTGLRALIERLLESCECDEPLLQPGMGAGGPLWEELARRHCNALWLEPGERVGPWRISRTIGRGGMATVYLAERADGQFEQRIALKILDAAKHYENVAARFAQERRILAKLEHANIARLIDGGVTPAGQPYVAMEYVDGQPIDVYCDAGRLGVQERISLFEQIADAVSYAHGHLIIHRDIKPSNVLVGAGGTPKLLDFGIAKLLGSPTQHGAPMTVSAMHPMTPEYASPEQIRGEPLTTAVDVYQLGFLLYRLLTGRTPYDLDQHNVAEILHTICDVEPLRPSALLGVTSELAASRATTPQRLRSQLEGDLDNILLTALRKEPDRRYSSVFHLQEDLQRHREGRPVRARPAALRYRAAKFVLRNRAAVAASIAVLASILIGLGAALWQAGVARQQAQFAHASALRAQAQSRRAEQETAVAKAVTAFLNQDVLAGANPVSAARPQLTVAEVLDTAAASAGERFAKSPRVEGAVRLAIGEAYLGLGRIPAAQAQLRSAIALLHGSVGSEHADTIWARLHLADVLMFQGQLESAREQLHQGTSDAHRAQLYPAWLHGEGRQAGLARMEGHHEAAIKQLKALLPTSIEKLGDGDETTQELREMLAGSLQSTGATESSIVIYEQALKAAVERFGPQHVATMRPRANLGNALRVAGRLEEAYEPLQTAVDSYRTALGNEHVQTLWSMQLLGALQRQRGRTQEAKLLLEASFAGRVKVLGPTHPNTLAAMRQLARLERDMGAIDRAAELLGRIYAANRDLRGAADPRTIADASALADILELQGRTDEAKRVRAQ